MPRDVTPSSFSHRHLLGIEDLSPDDINILLDLADSYVALNRRAEKKRDLLRGRTQINMFFESSTRTRTSFELAGKRLGADVINMAPSSSAIKKGETLVDTAATLNAMHPDLLIVRHPDSGAVKLLARSVRAAVINAGDGSHEHPDPGPARRAHHPSPSRTSQRPDSRHLRRHCPQPGGPFQHAPPQHHGRQGASRRPSDPAAAEGRRIRCRGSPRHDGGTEGSRHRHDVAAADGTDAGKFRAVPARVLPVLRA